MNDLDAVSMALEKAKVEFQTSTLEVNSISMRVLYCKDPDANELMFVEDKDIQVIQEDMINMAPIWCPGRVCCRERVVCGYIV